jgi:small-conductance mechanosensitive channel
MAGAGAAATGARARLRSFRQVTILAVAVTAFLLMLLAPDEGDGAQQPVPADTPAAPAAVQEIPDTVVVIEPIATEELVAAEQPDEPVSPDVEARAATEEAVEALQELWLTFLRNLPRFLVTLVVFFFAWLVVRVTRPILRRVLRGWERTNAFVALTGVVVWLLAIGIAVSVLVGDIRALVGSLGLAGLALSWALQTPIESFTGWLLNSLQGYYRVGDRVAVGEVFGDVYRIDILTTTVWEIGGPERGGFVAAEQPTGRLITFPNYEVLRGSIVNLTRDFPYVWDEIDVPIANRSDIPYAAEVLRDVGVRLIGESMAAPAHEYETILRSRNLETFVADAPQVFVSLDDSWTNLTLRYLVAARERRKWKSDLSAAILAEFNRAEHQDRIISVFPRRQIQFIGPDGKAKEVEWMGDA